MLCINCKYHELKEEERIKRHRKFPEEHVCLHPEYALVDNVTGEVFYANCYAKNNYGECFLFEELPPEEDPSEEIPPESDNPELPLESDEPEISPEDTPSDEDTNINDEESND